MMKKKAFSFFVILILLCSISAAKVSSVDSFQTEYTLGVGNFKVLDENGKKMIYADGFSYYPSLSETFPVKVLYYVIPPNAKVEAVEVESYSLKLIDYDEPFISNNKIDSDKNILPTNLPCLYYEQGRFRDLNFIKIYYFPILSSGKSLYVYKEVRFNIRMDYSNPNITLSDYYTFDEIAKKLFANYNQFSQWYKKPLIIDNSDKVDFLVVISNSSLEKSIEDFVKYKKDEDHFSVKVVTISEVKLQSQGKNTEEQLRNYLKEHFKEWGLKYVLLIGDLRSIPMWYMYPEPNEKRDEDSKSRYIGRTPSDFLYAELDSNWDYDGDGLPGEYEEDTDYIEDYYPDIFVGRIPFDDDESVRIALSNSIRYENYNENFRKSALLVGAMLYYAEEGTSRQDGALALNFAYENYLKPAYFNVKSMYEKEGTKPSIFDSDLPLTNENFVREIKSGNYGLILWNAHGSPQYVARKYWQDTNNDGKVDSGEIKWIEMLTTNDLNGYKLAPSIIYASSCETAWPERNSFSRLTLLKGASAYIGASRISYGGGTIDPILEGFVKYYALYNFGCGDALNISLFDAPKYSKYDFVNLYDYNLYGDPSLRVNNTNASGICLKTLERNIEIYQGKSKIISIETIIDDSITTTLKHSIDIEGVKCEFSEDKIESSGTIQMRITCNKDSPTGDFTLNVFLSDSSGNVIYGYPIHIKVLESSFSVYDLNRDGKVDLGDLSILKVCFGKSSGEEGFVEDADFNGDGIINGCDLIMLSYYIMG